MSDKERGKIVCILSLVRDIKWHMRYNEAGSDKEIYKRILEIEKVTQEIIYEDI